MSPSSHTFSLYYNCYYHFICAIALFPFFSGVVTAKSKSSGPGYSYGQNVPISCLSRSIDTGEHITDGTGNLKYDPFPICNETSAPLSFRYGVSETITCTVDPVTDTLYHLLEYYVHSDVPLSCRMPTFPLLDNRDPHSGSLAVQDTLKTKTNDGAGGDTGELGGAASPFTPISIALQGTLQLSHLHIWTDMSVLVHQVPVPETLLSQKSKEKKEKENKKMKKKKEEKKKSTKDIRKQRGQVYAGTAYSIPTVNGGGLEEEEAGSDTVDVSPDVSVNPWETGHGAKVIRGEPLRFTFRVAWVQGEDVLQALNGPSKVTSGGVFSSIFMFIMAGGIGAIIALWCDKWYKQRRGHGGWKGDGLLGHSGPGRITIGGPMAFGPGAKSNGYGGHHTPTGNGFSHGYGGYSSGKRD